MSLKKVDDLSFGTNTIFFHASNQGHKIPLKRHTTKIDIRVMFDVISYQVYRHDICYQQVLSC